MNTTLFAILLAPLAAQEPQKSELHPKLPPITEALHAGADDPHAEIKRLFAKVETRLHEIDRLLSDASAGETSAAHAGEAVAKAAHGISDLIDSSQAGGQSVVKDIDRILELANHPHPPGAG